MLARLPQFHHYINLCRSTVGYMYNVIGDSDFEYCNLQGRLYLDRPN